MGMPKTRGCPYHCDTGLPSGREPVPGVQIVERGRKIHEQKKKKRAEPERLEQAKREAAGSNPGGTNTQGL